MDLALADTPLLAAAQRGEPSAIAQLLRRYQPDVRRYAQRQCLLSDIDDAVQETLLILVRKVHQLHRLSAISAWLFQIVRRNCHRLARSALHYDPWEDGKTEAFMAQRSAHEAQSDVAEALESLPAHYREVIVLRDFAGHTMAEIAEVLGLSTAAAKSRLHRARELAREHLLA
jgi:RNA polymerase sigma factor (sigma-70 family)